MNKSELVSAMAEQTGLSKRDSEQSKFVSEMGRFTTKYKSKSWSNPALKKLFINFIFKCFSSFKCRNS